jgi:hypothetical protein
MKKSKAAEMLVYAYQVATIEDSVSIVRHCEIKDKLDTIGYLIVNSNTSETNKDCELISVGFNGGLDEGHACEVCDITPKEYKEILNKERKLPKGWKLKEVLFDGTFIYDKMDDLEKSLKDWPYSVEIDDQPERRLLGFKCKSGRKWQISFINFKKSNHSFKTPEDKQLFIKKVNTKPFYNKDVVYDW